MRSTFTGIEIAKRSLFTQQAALQVTGHNVANSNTVGYSRQTINMVAAAPLEALSLTRSTIPGQMGQGVEFDQVKRLREGFLDDQYHNENKSLGEWSVQQDTLEKLEKIINEPSDNGIRQVIQNFWDSWQDLSKEPDNLTARAVVKERALGLTEAFNQTSQKLKDLSGDITDSIRVKLTQANSSLAQIANLNDEIFRIEGLGNNANDLRDQRDLLVDNISKTVNISVKEDSSGYTISMGSTNLVEGKNVTSTLDPTSVAASLTSGDLTSGEIYGLLISRDKRITGYQDQMDSMVQALATQVNTIHKSGYTMEYPVKNGQDFFVMKSGATALDSSSITVNQNIVDDVQKIAASGRTYTDASGNVKVVQGNNDVALQLAGVRNSTINFDPANTGKTVLATGTFDDFFRAVVGQLGVQTQEATRQADNQKALVDQVDSRRQSVSGVSMDEEMANMIKFQQSYNAAARVLTTFDETLDKVINSMGLVGR
ncbi:flagellar hook-associated protein FlgK [Paenibacillus frigoriresistens]|uniref:flagellar hook-associated protein FlgK n=1 Tax=Paenibacillus alginolyticus TaxID=59839 RepID=UPI001565426E|nr:flagellar hook-associated protein FlgK [Paenibacillus frigoriresistens]NRF93649.1 flagellar hook-associated protein FlgK [Paenibacillus frigoriresistens]